MLNLLPFIAQHTAHLLTFGLFLPSGVQIAADKVLFTQIHFTEFSPSPAHWPGTSAVLFSINAFADVKIMV